MSLSKPLYSVLFAFMILSALQACNTGKKLPSMVYFNQQGDSTLATTVQKKETLIQPGDRLSIVITAFDAASVAPYNLGGSIAASAPGASATAASPAGGAGQGYLVVADGTIRMPQLGQVAVTGLTRKQLVELLTDRLKKFVTDPLVVVEFLNFKVTVLGEVARPGTVTVPDGKITLIEALGQAGDLPLTARRDNITVIRENGDVREFGKVNLLSKNVFNSPYYNLKQNDIVYVELTKEKAASTDQTLVRNISITASVLSVLSTLFVLIVNITK